jgi:raffinose/stachyose/melibiose transport system substrate-binding protein
MAIMRDLGQYIQPGFVQLMRDDATLFFVQGKALMIASGSWDATSIRAQAEFPVVIGPVPVPSPGSDPRWPYGKGPLADASFDAGVVMATTRNSKHPQVALDFLYFMASKKGNQLWSDVSGWLPSVVGVRPSKDIMAFEPVRDGYLGGFRLNISEPDGLRVYGNSLNQLVNPRGSVDAFRTTLSKELPRALEEDLRRSSLNVVHIAQRNDTLLAAMAMLVESGDERAAEKLDLLLQGSASNDFSARRTPSIWRSFQGE